MNLNFKNRLGVSPILAASLVVLVVAAAAVLAQSRAKDQAETAPSPTASSSPTTTYIPSPTSESSNYEKGVVLVGFKESTDLETAKKIIEGEYSLQVTAPLVPTTSYKIAVPEGQEQSWIKTLEKDSRIKYAELNHIIEIPDCNLGPC